MTTSRKKGFTLIEVTTSLFIIGLTTAMLLNTTQRGSLSLNTSVQKVDITHQLREITAKLSNDARQAQTFYLFEDASSLDTPVKRGESGNYLVLIKLRPYNGFSLETSVPGDPVHLVSLICYQTTSQGDQRPLYRTAITFSTPLDAVETDIFTLIQSTADSPGKEFMGNSLAREGQGLFYFHSTNTLMASGEIQSGNDFQTTTNTYNFTFSTRG